MLLSLVGEWGCTGVGSQHPHSRNNWANVCGGSLCTSCSHSIMLGMPGKCWIADVECTHLLSAGHAQDH